MVNQRKIVVTKAHQRWFYMHRQSARETAHPDPTLQYHGHKVGISYGWTSAACVVNGPLTSSDGHFFPHGCICVQFATGTHDGCISLILRAPSALRRGHMH